VDVIIDNVSEITDGVSRALLENPDLRMLKANQSAIAATVRALVDEAIKTGTFTKRSVDIDVSE
jgi:hypothetical protein